MLPISSLIYSKLLSYRHYLTEGMGRYQHRRARRPGATDPAPDPSAANFEHQQLDWKTRSSQSAARRMLPSLNR